VIAIRSIDGGLIHAAGGGDFYARPIENAIVVRDHAKITVAVGWHPTITLEAALRDVYAFWK